jgi:hypothetical protein
VLADKSDLQALCPEESRDPVEAWADLAGPIRAGLRGLGSAPAEEEVGGAQIRFVLGVKSYFQAVWEGATALEVAARVAGHLDRKAVGQALALAEAGREAFPGEEVFGGEEEAAEQEDEEEEQGEGEAALRRLRRIYLRARQLPEPSQSQSQSQVICALHCTLHCTALHTAHCTLHTAHCTLHTAHCTLHTV